MPVGTQEKREREIIRSNRNSSLTDLTDGAVYFRQISILGYPTGRGICVAKQLD